MQWTGGAIMVECLSKEDKRKAGLPPEGVHKALTREEAERYAAALSDKEVILLDALLASLG